jgi:hypothetical protein
MNHGIQNTTESITTVGLANEVAEQAAVDAERIDLQPKGQLATAIGTATAAGSLTYFLGAESEVFSTGLTGTESPLYIAYTAIALIAMQSLLSICGKKATKEMIAGVLTGASGALGVAGVITAMAFGLVGDLFTFGGFTIGGALLGWWLTRRGKKTHAPCGMDLPCQTWVCPKCKYLINPTMEWAQRDDWNILDVCQYLDVGGKRMNALKAIAFLDFANALHETKKRPDTPALWKPHRIKEIATDDTLVDRFSDLWSTFTRTYAIDDPKADIEKLLLQWERFRTNR